MSGELVIGELREVGWRYRSATRTRARAPVPRVAAHNWVATKSSQKLGLEVNLHVRKAARAHAAAQPIERAYNISTKTAAASAARMVATVASAPTLAALVYAEKPIGSVADGDGENDGDRKAAEGVAATWG